MSNDTQLRSEMMASLVQKFESADAARKRALKSLQEQATEEFNIKKGDILLDRKGVERLVIKIWAVVYAPSDWNPKTNIAFKAMARKRTAKGWHAVENELYSFENWESWKIVGHEVIGDAL